MPKRAANPFALGYDPETVVSPKLGSDLASYLQIIIGVLRLIIELGKIYTITITSGVLIIAYM